MGRPKGSNNKPRARMQLLINEQWPKFDPVARMIEQAEKTRLDMARRDRLYKQAVKDDAPLDVQAALRVNTGERNLLSGMYERASRYLAPQLKSHEVKVDADLQGDVTVRFMRDGEAPERG